MSNEEGESEAYNSAELYYQYNSDLAIAIYLLPDDSTNVEGSYY